MAKKTKPPCIRGLKQFCSGCPEREWDGYEGCPAWVSRVMPKKDNPLQFDNHAMCVDLWTFRLLFDACGLLEGNQQAIESFRNNMSTVDETGRGVPKPDPASVAVYQILTLQAQRAGLRREAIERNAPLMIEGDE